MLAERTHPVPAMTNVSSLPVDSEKCLTSDIISTDVFLSIFIANNKEYFSQGNTFPRFNDVQA